MERVLDGWTAEHTNKFQNDVLTFRHRIAESGLFTDEALIALMEKHPSEKMDVCTMGDAEHPLYPNKFRTGDFRGVPGQVLLDAAKAGRVWINVREAMNIHPEYRAVLDAMYGELAEVTGNRAFNARGGILISSPVARVPYHFDKTETILWHVRGRKRLYLWPVNQKFIPDTAHEAILNDILNDDLPYSFDWDEEATIIDLEDGQAATWPLNSPHKVENQTFCVSVTTEYSTPQSATKNATMMTNAALRRFGMNPLYENDGPVSRRVKSVAGRVIRKARLVPRKQEIDLVTFKIDPDSDDFIVDTDPYERSF